VQCAESLRVQAYFDGEVDAVSAIDVERHAERCPECRALLEHLARTRARLRAELDFPTAPPQLRAALARRLDEEASARAPRATRRVPPAWRTRPFWLGAAGGMGTALAASLALFVLSPAPRETALDGLVSAHVRSLLPAHLTDVVSTDRHTVRPWFAGHADVSPVVADFSPAGYRLLGGRVDYFEHQRAAVVVYEHGQHVINVFTWAAGGRALPQFSTRNGYHIACWKSSNLQYCAVSDTGWDELQGLARLLRETAGDDTPR
jgi:anti-sigma factor RsiW